MTTTWEILYTLLFGDCTRLCYRCGTGCTRLCVWAPAYTLPQKALFGRQAAIIGRSKRIGHLRYELDKEQSTNFHVALLSTPGEANQAGPVEAVLRRILPECHYNPKAVMERLTIIL